MLFQNGQQTRLQAGDVIVFDISNEMWHFERAGERLSYKSLDEDSLSQEYYLRPTDGVQIDSVPQMVADACGLGYEKIEDDSGLGNYDRFRFL